MELERFIKKCKKCKNSEERIYCLIFDRYHYHECYKTYESIKNIIKDLSNDPRVAGGNGRIKTQSHESNPLGYSGNIVNIKTSNGLTAEIQVNTPKMIYAKEKPENAKRILGETKYNQIAKEVGIEGGKGHDLYEKYRVLVAGKDDKQRKKIEQESKKYYSNFLK